MNTATPSASARNLDRLAHGITVCEGGARHDLRDGDTEGAAAFLAGAASRKVELMAALGVIARGEL